MPPRATVRRTASARGPASGAPDRTVTPRCRDGGAAAEWPCGAGRAAHRGPAAPAVQMSAVQMSAVQVSDGRARVGRDRPAARGVRPRAARRRRARHLSGVRRPRTCRTRAGSAARPPRCPPAAARRARGGGATIARATTRHREPRRRPRRPARRRPAQASLHSGTSPRRRSAPLARTCSRHAPATNGVMRAHGSWARAADRGCVLGPSGYRGAPISGGLLAQRGSRRITDTVMRSATGAG